MAFLPENIVDEVRLASDVVDVISDYVTLKKRGQNYFAVCPFHSEKTGSFSVNQEKQIFHCFGCGAGGNVFTFIMRHEGVSFPESVRMLAKRAGIDIPEPEQGDMEHAREREALYFATELAAGFFADQLFTDAGKHARDYILARGFDEDGLRTFGVGYAPDSWDQLLKFATGKGIKPELLEQAGLVNKRDNGGHYDRFRNRLIFPIQNLSGKTIAFGGRRLVEDEKSPKYVNSPETPIYHKSQVLYGLFQARDAIRAAKEVVFVEGYTDVMRLSLSGIAHVVATSGTALTDQQAQLIRRYSENVVLLYDSDTAGQAATLRGADVLVERGVGVRLAELGDGEDPDSFVQLHGAPALLEKLKAAPALLDFKSAKLGSADAGETRSERLRSLIKTLSRIQDGVQRQELVHHYAEKMQLDEEIIWDEVRRLRRMQRSSSFAPNERIEINLPQGGQSNFATRSRAVEEELIRIMLLHAPAVPYVFSFMELTDFFNDDYRHIATILWQLYENKIRYESEDLIHYFKEPETAAFVSRVVNQEAKQTGVSGAFQKWAADCLAKLQKLMLETRIAEVQEQIRAREKSGGDAAELLESWHELQRQRTRISAKNFLPQNPPAHP